MCVFFLFPDQREGRRETARCYRSNKELINITHIITEHLGLPKQKIGKQPGLGAFRIIL
jgi:hypothetical protein